MNTRKLWRMLCATLLCAALLLGTAVAEPDMLELDTANATEEDVALELEEGLGEAPEDLPDLDLDLELSLDGELETVDTVSAVVEEAYASIGGNDDQPTETFVITFVDEDGTVLKSREYPVGAIPKYDDDGAVPVKEQDAGYDYSFVGWLDSGNNLYREGQDLPLVTGVATYTASFERTDRLYTITFVDEDGKTEIEKSQYKYEEIPRCSKTPTKDGYTFAGWLDADNKLTRKDADLPKVTADATYRASYEEEVRTNVPLKVTYTGEPLTKVYDLTRNAFTKTSSGGYTFLVTAPKAADFTVEPADSGDKAFFDKHKDVRVKVTSIKSVKQFTSSDVGSYTLTFTFGLEGSDARYYTAQAVDIPATITAREVVVTPRAGLSKVYGTKGPAYPDNSWLSTDTSSPLHQDISGQPGYAVPVNVNSQTGKLSLSVTQQAYLLAEAKKNNTKFFPNGWLSRESGEDVGKYDITIGGMDFGKNFKVTLKHEVFTITAKPLSDANITVDDIPNQAYTGKAIKLDEKTLVVRYGTMTLKKGTDYTVKYENNTEVGTAKVTLTGRGNYSGTKEVTFNIIKSGSGDDDPGSGSGTAKDPLAPKGTRLTKLKAGRKQIQVKWKKCKKITGYQIAYSLTRDFAIWEDVIVRNPKKTSVTLKGLKKKRTYYVRIRTYKRLNGHRHWSPWSACKKIKTK